MSRSLRPDAVLVQAVIAGALSFAHLHDLAEAAGQDGWKAWAYPVSVDLLLVAAWHRLRTLRASGGNRQAAWTWFAVALSASLGANVATAGLLDLSAVPAWLRILVAGWPALAFLGGTLLAHQPASETGTAADASAAVEVERAKASASAAPAPAPSSSPVEPTTAPALPTVEPEPAASPESAEPAEPVKAPSPAPAPARPAPTVPAALVEHARKVADAHRDRTGSPIDTDTLRARLGVPPVLADQIAAQLT